MLRKIMFSVLMFFLIYSVVYSDNHEPVVKNVSAKQRPGTRFVDITYDVEDADGDVLEITIKVSNDGGKTFNITPKALTGDVGKGIQPGKGKKVVWDVVKDLPKAKGNFKVRVIADDGVAPPVTGQVITGKDGAKMVLIPAGEFSMGDAFNEGRGGERPVHTVYLDTYYMDVYEVTNAQYAKFLNDYGKNTDAAGHKLLNINCDILKVGNTYQPKAGYENHPVICVTWYGAAAYAQFYGKRLPTEAEWEKAARGGLVGKRYPWGDDITHDNANYSGTGGKDKWDRTSPVGSFAPNGYGLYDLAGNVWEWCADEYASDYYSKSPKNNPKGPGVAITFKNNDFTNVSTWRVFRGGSWSYDPNYLRYAGRYGDDPASTFYLVGFRCSQDQ
jgi:formylglycine-generating enzyme required for sulfatase activity